MDAIIYGRDLKSEEGNVGNEERFDKIRYYLRHSLYPQGADRSEKSRLRSAATHYKLIPAHDGVAEKLMLKDKEVISDPQAQYDIAKQIHLLTHGGINKTTAVIATKYHWVRIKETVSHVIKNCPDCKDTNKPPMLGREGTRSARSKTLDGVSNPLDLPPLPTTPIKQEGTDRDQEHAQTQDSMPPPSLPPAINQNDHATHNGHNGHNGHMQPQNHISPQGLQSSMQSNQMAMDMSHQQLEDDDFKADHMDEHLAEHISPDDYRAIQQQMGMTQDGDISHSGLQNADSEMLGYDDIAIDPQIMEQIQAEIAAEGFGQQQGHMISMGPPPHHNMQHFGDGSRPSIQGHPDIHSDPGPHPHPSFPDPSQMQQTPSHDPRSYSQHQSPTDFSQPNSQYISPVQQPHNMMAHPVPDDHIMGGQLDDNGGGGMNNMQQMGHVLSMEYMNTSDATNHGYPQQRQ